MKHFLGYVGSLLYFVHDLFAHGSNIFIDIIGRLSLFDFVNMAGILRITSVEQAKETLHLGVSVYDVNLQAQFI